MNDIENITAKIDKIPSKVRAIYLPDIHTKKHLEAPTSLVVVTDGTIIQDLVPPSLGCGMGLVATSLYAKDITKATTDKFFAEIKSELDFRPLNTVRNFLLWLGVTKRKVLKYDFSPIDLERAMTEGSEFAIGKYGLNPNTKDNIEYRGNVLDKKLLSEIGINNVIPRGARVGSRNNIGYGYGGNHFLEVQAVNNIFDTVIAEKWGLKKDQVTIMYHGGEGSLAYYIGRYFSNRKKVGKKEALLMLPAKIIFHFKSLTKLKFFVKRIKYYFLQNLFQEISIANYEGKRRLLSTMLSQNYSFAYRIAIVKRISDALIKTFGTNTKSKLIWDASHVSIIEGEDNKIIHQSGAYRVHTGKPLLISGTKNSVSYLCLGLKDAYVDHGFGKLIEKSGTRESANDLIKKYENNGIIKLVATLMPIATHKD